MNTEVNKLEFNTIKTIKLINCDNLLKKVYGNRYEKYSYNTLLPLAEANNLTDEAIQTLKDIFDSIVITSEFHTKIYNKLEIKRAKPRRYGKTQIQADIKVQGGVPTSLQETMLELADLKALTSTLLGRGTSDRFNGTQKLTDDKQRKIKAAIRDIKTKLKNI